MKKSDIKILCENKYGKGSEHATTVSEQIYHDYKIICKFLEGIEGSSKNLALKCLINEYLNEDNDIKRLDNSFILFENASNSKSLLFEDTLTQSAGRGITNATTDSYEPNSEHLKKAVGFTTGLAAARPATNAIMGAVGKSGKAGNLGVKMGKSAAKYNKSFARGAGYLRTAGRRTKDVEKGAHAISNAVKAYGGGSKMGTGIIKLVEKFFPKLAPKAGKILLKGGPKLLKGFLVGATAGTWLIFEVVLFVISHGGIALLKTNTKGAKWVVKKAIEFIRKHPNWTKTINIAYNIFMYGDLKKAILVRGIELGYITKEEATKLDSDSSLMGGDDYSDVEVNQTNSGDEANQEYSQNYNTQPLQQQAQVQQTQPVQQTGQLTVQQAFRDIAQFKGPNGWLYGARQAGWPEEKIQQYRMVINNYYNQRRNMNNTQMNEDKRLRESIERAVLDENIWSSIGKAFKKPFGRFTKPKQIPGLVDKLAALTKKGGRMTPELEREIQAALQALAKEDAALIRKLNSREFQLAGKMQQARNLTTANFKFKKIGNGKFQMVSKNGRDLGTATIEELRNILKETKTDGTKIEKALGKAQAAQKHLNSLRGKAGAATRKEKENLAAQIKELDKLKSQNARIMAAIAAALGLGAGLGAGYAWGNSNSNAQMPTDPTPGGNTPLPNDGLHPVQPTPRQVDPQVTERIKLLQQKLIENGWHLGDYGPNHDGVDGKAGPMTRKCAQDAGVDFNAWIAGNTNQTVNPKRLTDNQRRVNAPMPRIETPITPIQTTPVSASDVPIRQISESELKNLVKGCLIKELKKYKV